MKLIWPYLKQNALAIILGLICMVVVDAAQLVIPQIIKQAVDTLSRSSLDRQMLLQQCLFIVAIGIVMGLLRYGWRNLLMGAARRMERGIRDQLFKHVIALDAAFHDRTRAGDIMAHATSDITHVRMGFGFGLIVLVDTLLLGGATLAIMTWTHPKLTLAAMLPMPLLVYLTRTLGRKMHQFHTTAQEAFSTLTEMVREHFLGIRVIKVFNFETAAADKIDQVSTDYFHKNLKRAVVMALLKPLLNLFFNLSSLVIVFYGGLLVMQQTLSPGELVAFLQYLGILAWPVIAIGWMTNLFQRGMASLKRINRLLESRPAVTDTAAGPCGKGRPRPLSGIAMSQVFFSYEKDHPVLSDISFEAGPGMAVGLTGPPGSGKTSLVSLIPRIYNPDSGRLHWQGQNLSELSLTELRSQVAFMPQESFLFSGTIRDNILMGRSVPPHRLDQILQLCCLDQTLSEMPQGLSTLVGERGITLSGGQKQRIALARTLVEKRPLVILDDPISQVDTRTASAIIHGLTRELSACCRIIISHRLAALAGCDCIHILDRGRIQASGTHDQLIRTSRFYSDSFRVQQFEEKDHG